MTLAARTAQAPRWVTACWAVAAVGGSVLVLSSSPTQASQHTLGPSTLGECAANGDKRGTCRALDEAGHVLRTFTDALSDVAVAGPLAVQRVDAPVVASSHA